MAISDVMAERQRIRAALLQPCNDQRCLLPIGHVGGHYWSDRFDPKRDGARIPITRERLEEILSG